MAAAETFSLRAYSASRVAAVRSLMSAGTQGARFSLVTHDMITSGSSDVSRYLQIRTHKLKLHDWYLKRLC